MLIASLSTAISHVENLRIFDSENRHISIRDDFPPILILSDRAPLFGRPDDMDGIAFFPFLFILAHTANRSTFDRHCRVYFGGFLSLAILLDRI